jgi:hypothetical protein
MSSARLGCKTPVLGLPEADHQLGASETNEDAPNRDLLSRLDQSEARRAVIDACRQLGAPWQPPGRSRK